MPHQEEDEPIPHNMTQEQLRDAEYHALVTGQRTLINQVTELARVQRAMERRYDAKLREMGDELSENTKATQDVKENTAGVVEALQAIQGGMKVLAWLGKAARPVMYLAVPGAVLLAAWHNGWETIKNMMHWGRP